MKIELWEESTTAAGAYAGDRVTLGVVADSSDGEIVSRCLAEMGVKEIAPWRAVITGAQSHFGIGGEG